ncbi:MAG: hypothetical protein NWE93_14995 [Candidatus Bathyarchaeota archaeon]|nr:hypothetical protein [Candidatus Bathyarchaeota archaeon]
MSGLKDHCKIYIIESQRDSDILDNRTEGRALSASLDLAQIQNIYYQVVTIETLEECFRIISDDISFNRLRGLIAPFIHISAHGNRDGIILTDNTFIDWDRMRQYIDKINVEIGFIKPIPSKPKFNVSVLNLCFSTCEGINANKIQGDLSDNKYVCLVGPSTSVDWSDSLIAFVTFYHQVFYKNKTASEAITNMNAASGLNNIFQISNGSGLKLSE